MMYKYPLGILVTVAKNEVRLREYFPLRLLSKHFFFYCSKKLFHCGNMIFFPKDLIKFVSLIFIKESFNVLYVPFLLRMNILYINNYIIIL